MTKRIAKPTPAPAAEQPTPPPPVPANPQPEPTDWTYAVKMANVSYLDVEIGNASLHLSWLLREVFTYMKARNIEYDIDGFRKAFETIIHELEADYCNYSTWLDSEKEDFLHDSKN